MIHMNEIFINEIYPECGYVYVGETRMGFALCELDGDYLDETTPDDLQQESAHIIYVVRDWPRPTVSDGTAAVAAMIARYPKQILFGDNGDGDPVLLYTPKADVTGVPIH
jgi:hypothetical protein